MTAAIVTPWYEHRELWPAFGRFGENRTQAHAWFKLSTGLVRPAIALVRIYSEGNAGVGTVPTPSVEKLLDRRSGVNINAEGRLNL